MNAPNRVDELRKRYHENPRRFFAPLANEYRKTGFVDRAILLCEKHLGEQPGNMNGLVVYGQCLFETGRLEDARAPFEMALGLDPENLIALRHLGDIARMSGDAPKAREWYGRLLEFDRRNDEVIGLLAEVGGGEEKPATASQAPNIVSVAGSVRVTTSAESVGMVNLDEAATARPTTPRASAGITATPRASAAVPTPSQPATAVPGRTAPVTPLRPLRAVDPSAKTVEVSAQPRPAKRESLLDVSFDFGEIGAEGEAPAPPAPEALLPSEAAEYGFAPPQAARSAEDALDDLDALIDTLPSSPPPARPVVATPEPPASLIESAPEGESLAALPEVAGIEKAEFSAEVSPLDGLESSEFHGGEAERLADLEPLEFEPPSRPSMQLEGLESDEFQPLGLEETSGPGVDASPDESFEEATETAAAAEQELPDDMAAPPDARASVAGLPLLEPFGTPTPLATPTVDDLPLLPSLEAAVTVPIDLEAARRSMETPPTFVTETMAQVYVQQGHHDKAIEVYRQLIAQSPDDAGLQQRLAALESPPAAVPTDTRTSLGFDTPLSTEPVDEPAPANAMLSATSFDGISLSTPAAPARPSTPPLAAAAVTRTGPSAREFFSRFARRAATPVSTPSIEGAPTIGGKLMSPLDELFGTQVAAEDEVAAHRLAGVGATSGPSGGSALDSLFGEGPSAPMPSSTPSRGSVTRASEKLRFDQFFASSTPVEGSLAASASESQPAPEPPSAEPGDPAGSDEPGEDDDLDQFQGWLRGLTS